MIVGPDFIWLHFPNCAGRAVEAALRRLIAGSPGVQFDHSDGAIESRYDTVLRRRSYNPSFSPGDRRIICGFRRLPSWIISRVHHDASSVRPYRAPTRKMLLKGRFFEPDGVISSADQYAIQYSNPKVARWIRTEYLARDLSAAFGLDPAAVETAVATRDGPELPYIRPVAFWFTDAELAALYAANPVWSRIEQELYGSLLQ